MDKGKPYLDHVFKVVHKPPMFNVWSILAVQGHSQAGYCERARLDWALFDAAGTDMINDYSEHPYRRLIEISKEQYQQTRSKFINQITTT